MADASERTEQPTSKRREEARRHGQVAVSPEIGPVAVLLAAVMIAPFGLPVLFARSRWLLEEWLRAIGTVGPSDGLPWPLLQHSFVEMGRVVGPFALMVAAVGTAAMVAQVGWSVNPEMLQPKLSRVSLASGAGRLFSLNGVQGLVKSVVKILLGLWVSYLVVRDALPGAVSTPGMPLEAMLLLTGTEIRRLALHLALTLGVLALADFLWARWRHEQSLKMSRQEVKEETKQGEGDPQVKARFRRAQRELAKRRMLSAVREADVVLTNPVHVAVALRYRPAESAAPRVVAKGAGELAARIKEKAREAGVPIVERRALARALYRAVEIGAEIPPALYRAVAEILAYIYSLRSAAPGVR